MNLKNLNNPRKVILKLLFICFCLSLIAFNAMAEGVTFDFGKSGGALSARLINLLLLLSVISLAPSILIMTTSFTRITVVLSFLRSAIGLQQTPPNMVLVSLSLFLTLFIMAPTLEKSYKDGVVPLMEEKISEEEAWNRSTAPIHKFMLSQVRENDLKLFINLAQLKDLKTPDAVPLRVLTPAFMISELKRAFEIGFLLFIPFLIIDLVVASLLMSMGMMMLPPVIVSLPFKLVFFVLIDGWNLIIGSIIKSFQ